MGEIIKSIAFLLALPFISFSGIYSECVDIDNTLRNSDEIIAIAHRSSLPKIRWLLSDLLSRSP